MIQLLSLSNPRSVSVTEELPMKPVSPVVTRVNWKIRRSVVYYELIKRELKTKPIYCSLGFFIGPREEVLGK